MVTRTAGRRWLAAAVAAVVAVGLQVVTAQPAAALPPLTLTTGMASPDPNTGDALAEARCAANQLVVGGGGEVLDFGQPLHTTVLTALVPHAAEGAKPPRFVVRAHALVPGEFWRLKAYALCAPAASMQPYLINDTTTSSTSTSQFGAGTSRCPGGRVAYSAGVTTSNNSKFTPNTSLFGVQLVRTSGPLDIARATVRAFNTTATPDPWRLHTFAVCGPRKDGIVAVARVAAGPFVGVSCPAGMQVHGAGGGLGLTDGGPNWIRMLRPANTLPGSMTVRMWLSSRVSMVAHTTCATRT